MTVTITDIANALDGLVIPFGGTGSPAFETTTGIVRPNPDGSYTVTQTSPAQDLSGSLVFSKATIPGVGPGYSYVELGVTFLIVPVAFDETHVLFQNYTATGVKVIGNHFLLTDGGPSAGNTTFPLILHTTGASYTEPNGTVITGAPCFGRGTIIATLDGDVAVEDLREGDLVLTVSGEAKPLVWTGSRSVDISRHPQPENVRPVCIRRSAFSPNVPSLDLVVSPDHNVFTDGVLVPAKCLVNGRTIVNHDVDTVHYHHIELASHDVVYANGLETETYLDTGNRTSFAGQGVTVAHPDFSSAPDQNYFAWEANGYARLVVEGAELDAVRARLATRADELAQLASTGLRRSA